MRGRRINYELHLGCHPAFLRHSTEQQHKAVGRDRDASASVHALLFGGDHDNVALRKAVLCRLHTLCKSRTFAFLDLLA